MPLTKAKGNMYEWVTHCHTHLRGACPHGCTYCSVQAIERRFHSGAYSGPLRLAEKEFAVAYGNDGKRVFVEHCADLFAEAVPEEWVRRVLAHCAAWPGCSYVFQTKNPARVARMQPQLPPPRFLLGVTIETDVWYPLIMRQAPPPLERYRACRDCRPDFVTIEPILRFNLDHLVAWLTDLRPTWVNIGADSKGNGLPEPTAGEVAELVAALAREGIEVREKRNLGRLREGG